MLQIPKRLAQPLLVLGLLLAGSIHAPLAETDILLPEIGDPSASVMNSVEEKQLGEAFFRSLHNQLEISQDPEIEDYIEALGHRLGAHSDAPGQTFHFFVVIDPIINAFAGPGGYIGTNSGLILNTESESELASVMAHEIAHITQRHLFRTFEEAGRMNLPSAAATLAAILIGSQAPELGQAALMAAQAGSIQHQINFTRDNEQEADRIGIQTLARAEFDPRSMPVFFERLQQSNRYYGNGPPEFLRTHPVTVSRISDSRGRAETYPYKQFPDSTSYPLFKAKLRILTSTQPKQVVKFFQAQLDQGTAAQKTAHRYGYALALAKTLDYSKALEILRDLAAKQPDNANIVNALAETEMSAGNTSQALQLYREARQRFPGNRALTLNYADVLIETGAAQQARELLMDYSKKHPTSPQIYSLLAQAYDRLDNPAESHRYLAEHYYLMGQTEAAIIQARIALRETHDNFYLSAVLDDRLKTFIAEEKARKERER